MLVLVRGAIRAGGGQELRSRKRRAHLVISARSTSTPSLRSHSLPCSSLNLYPRLPLSSASRSALVAGADGSIAPLYYLIRRPTYILDFALTLTFNHILFTTYYAKAFPTSLYVWVVQALGAMLMIVFGEQVSPAALNHSSLQSLASSTLVCAQPSAC